MPAHVTILCGPARSGKTERLLVRYRDALTRQPLGSSLWLAPTWRAAAEVRQRLLDEALPGCFQPGVMTFGNFAEAVLRAAELPMRPMTRLMKRELVRQILFEQSSRGRLKHFQSIAKTAGLVDLVCEFISELKRLEIWPDDFRNACAVRGIDNKDVELSEVYDVYQQSLREHRLFDAEGRFWSARDVLQKGEGGRFPTFIVADGFTDFTRTQHEILAILAGHGEEMFVTLPLEAEPRREDLFAKPLKTLSELRRRHARAAVEQFERPPRSQWPAMGRLERTLFENPRSATRLAAAGTADLESSQTAVSPSGKAILDIEILAAARQVGEIELIAGRIKRLLVDGEAKPGEIAVVFRSSKDAGPMVDEVFGRLGIPVVLESGQTLDHSPAIRALATLLQLDLDDWPFDRLLAVLGSNYFQPGWPEWRTARFASVEQTIRKLQIPRGRKVLIEQLATVGGDSSRRSASEDASYSESLLADVAQRSASAVATHLSAAFDALPQRATLPDWANAWRRLAEETGLLRAVWETVEAEKGSGGEGECGRHLSRNSLSALSDRRAWERLLKALAEGDTLAAWIEQRPPELDRRAAFEALVDIIGSDRIGHSGDESGCVRVLSAESVRSLRIPFVFLAGLSEKAFPTPDREDRLYNEADYLRLIDAGLPLVARTERTREEMLLFYEAVTRATKRLYLSYPALDESAQPLLPSPFLSEIEEAFGPGQIPRFERADLSPIPLDDEPLCLSDFRVKAVATALAGNVALLAGLFQENASGKDIDQHADLSANGDSSVAPAPTLPLSPSVSLIAGLDIIYQRQDRDRFSEAEGMLHGPETHAYLATQFHPQHVFSATQLERYASCPFRFFLEQILKIEPLEDLALEFDVMERGRIVHEVLATFHQAVNAKLGRPGSPLELDEAEFASLLSAAIQESLPPEPKNPVQAALREVDRRLVVEWLSKYREQVERYDAQWKDFSAPMSPTLFEASFGRRGESSPSVDEPFEFNVKGRTIRIAGRIDRIDTGEIAGHSVFNVVDYKTGGAIKLTPESVAAGTTLQLPIYAIAAMELLFADRDLYPWRAGYWYVRDDGFKPKQSLVMYQNIEGRIELDPEWEDIRDGLGEVVAGLVSSMCAGQFPVCSTDDHCTGHCPFNTVCRINQVRSLEKTWHPTASE